MRKRALVVALLVCIGVGAVIWGWPRTQSVIEVDSCLDRGGCWDSSLEQCEMTSQRRCG